MPRRSNNHHLQNNTQPQQPHQGSAMYAQTTPQRADPQVQRAQGVIFLSTNKPQIQTPQTHAPALSAHAQLAHQVNQVPAHHASLFQGQHMPAFVPPSIMQNPFFPYYHPMTHSAPTSTNNEVYTPNGGGGSGYDESMQVPPSPIRSKPKRRSRYAADDSDSSSDEAEFNDDEEDPDWAPTTGEEVPEPTYFENRRGTPRGRRPSTTPRGRGRGRGSRGGGRGRGRGSRGGRVSDAGMVRSDIPPTLQIQSSQMHAGQLGGRQTRNSLSMPSLDPQTGELTFGELVSAAVKSLNDPEDMQEYAAVIITLPDKVVLIEKVPLTTTTSIFVPVNTSVRSDDKENKDELALEAEDEDLIMAYEILQEEDKQRPFLCEVCGKASRSRVLHNRHLVTHAPTLRFACCICSQLFESHEKLKPHLRMHHGTGIFVCPEMDCEGVFQERKSLDDHDFACHPNARPFVCRFCLDRFPSVADANAHEDAHDEQITASCMKCNATYKTKTDLKNHYSHMHEEKQCKFCETKFENQPSLDEHLHEVHPEEMKPKPPTPEPPMDDDDAMPSPLGGNDDDDDDIVVVEEHKKVASASKKPEMKKPRRSETISTPKPGPSKPGPSKLGPTSRPPFILKPSPKSKPVGKSKLTSSDVITLSSDSDDGKDPEWSPGSKKSKRSYIPAAPVKRSSRRKAEYVIIVESRTDETANDVLQKTPKGSNQPLTFVMGDSGDLVHVPTSSDPHPPDSLPIKEIMDVIKRQKLTDNTTIVIEDNKISSVKPSSDPLKTDRPAAISRTSVVGSREIPAKKLVRPPPESIESNRIKPSSTAESVKSKPGALVAKKRTGGLPRTDNHSDKEKKSYEVPSPSSSSSERTKPKVAGPIAKKRTGGSSSIYDSIKQKSDKRDDSDPSRVKQSRKESHHMREDIDEPIIVEEHVPSHKSPVKPFKIPTHSSSSSSHKHKKRSKSGRKKGSKSQRREEAAKRKLQAEQAASEVTGSLTDYDSAPKRSLRIALKASVTDLPGEESQSSLIDDPIGDDYHSGTDSVSNSHRKRGRPSKTQSNTIDTISAIGGSSFGESNTSASAASNGQVVMKALVNGKWQDVVIGTKLANDPPDPVQTTSRVVPSTSRMEKPSRQVNAKKSTGGRKPPPPPPPAKITSGSRGGKRGRKGKNATQSADCWNDDRYQYFSDGSRAMGTLDTSQMYPDDISYKEDTGAEYEGYGGADDTVMPFSLSSYITYHQDQESLQAAEPEPEDQGLPVIVSAYHVDSKNDVNSYHDSYVDSTRNMYKEDSNNINQDVDETEDVDEIPLRDPLAMDDGPSEEAIDEDPLGSSEPAPPPPPQLPPVEPKKGTVQEAKSAISNLRSVLSQITFKR